MKKIQDLLDFVIIKDLNKNQIKLSSSSDYILYNCNDTSALKIWNCHAAIM